MKTGKHYFGMLTEDEQRNFKDEKPLTTFRLIFVYSIITFVALSLLLIAYKAGYDNGYNTGYQHGIKKVDSIVNYEELTPESVEAVQSMQLNTTRINENRPKR